MISFSSVSKPIPMRLVPSPEPWLPSYALSLSPGSSVATVSEGGKKSPSLGARLPLQIKYQLTGRQEPPGTFCPESYKQAFTLLPEQPVLGVNYKKFPSLT